MRSLRALLTLSAVLGLAVIPACKSAHLAGGKLHFDQGRYERALEQFQAAAEEQPDNAEVRLWLAQTYAELDEAEKADGEFTRAAELDPELAQNVSNARGHYWSDHHNQALSFASQGYDAEAQGDTAQAQESFAQALDEFETAIVYDPTRLRTQLQKGKLYYHMGRRDEAIAIIEDVHTQTEGGMEDDGEGSPQEDVNKLLLTLYWEMGDEAWRSEDWDSALSFYKQALSLAETDKDGADLNYQLGSTYFQMAMDTEGEDKAANYRNAVEYYNGVLDLVSEDQDALYNLTVALTELGEYEQAGKRGEELRDMNPKDPDFHYLLARIYSKLEMEAEFTAEFIFGEALKKGRKDAASRMRDAAQEYGPGTDILNTLRTMGEPEDVRRFSDNTGQEYLVWIYWSEGTAQAFINGAMKYQMSFKKVAGDDLGQR